MIESTLISTTILIEYQSIYIALISKIHQWKSCQWLQYLSEQETWISFLNYSRWRQQWTTWNQISHQTCWWNRIWIYHSQSLLWREQIVFQIRSNLMHLSHFKAVICSMFWLFAFEAEFFLKQLFLNRIEIQSSEFLSWRNWWRESNSRCAKDRASSLNRWNFNDWLSIQFS